MGIKLKHLANKINWQDTIGTFIGVKAYYSNRLYQSFQTFSHLNNRNSIS